MTTAKKYSTYGFTIVELVVVVVIISILATITIVSYNGIQDRARSTVAADSANQLRVKIEAWAAINGAYPTLSDVNGGLSDTVDPVAYEAAMNADLLNKIETTAAAVSQSKPLKTTVCPASGQQTGVQITYWQSFGSKTLNSGTGC